MQKENAKHSITIEIKKYNEMQHIIAFLQSENKKLDLENDRIKQENCYLKNTLAILKS